MTRERRNRIRSLQGERVSLALADGSRLDDCQLVSAGGHGTRTLWVFENGADRFVALDAVVDLWESGLRAGCGNRQATLRAPST